MTTIEAQIRLDEHQKECVKCGLRKLGSNALGPKLWAKIEDCPRRIELERMSIAQACSGAL